MASKVSTYMGPCLNEFGSQQNRLIQVKGQKILT